MPDEPEFRQTRSWRCFCYPERQVLALFASFSFNVAPYLLYEAGLEWMRLYMGEGQDWRYEFLLGTQQMSVSENPPGLPPGSYVFCGTGWLREIQLYLLGGLISVHDEYCTNFNFLPRPYVIPAP